MNNVKRMPVLEVAKVLRKYNDHRLNRKVYKNFDKRDFDSVNFIIENGYPRKEDMIKEGHLKTFRIANKKGKVLEFESIAEVCDFLEFKPSSHWRKKVVSLGFTILD